ncbi:hypothetical protein J41TS8_40270 [Bacillus sp. J41TS8]|nr:hypothetical protein J41TS8_40270 [Bacillus sp. J41TS8]
MNSGKSSLNKCPSNSASDIGANVQMALKSQDHGGFKNGQKNCESIEFIFPAGDNLFYRQLFDVQI